MSMRKEKTGAPVMVRPFQAGDIRRAARLFRDTVFRVNRADYTETQLRAWAAGADGAVWEERLSGLRTFAAERGGALLGFGSVREDGYVDHLFVHARHQGEGVGTALLAALEAAVPAGTLRTEASVTARPFFLARGWRAVREQEVFCRGECFVNFLMEKERKRQ